LLIIENIMLALNGLRSNKMRTFLTMLGIIIGICAVITIMTLGQSVTNKFTDSMQSIGASNVTVMIQQKADEDEDGDAAQGMMFMAAENQKVPTEKDYITDDMLSSLRENYDSEMLGIALSETVGTGKAEKGKLYANVTVMGINGDYFLSNAPAVLSGRMLTADELGGDRRIAVVSDKLVNNLFGGHRGNAGSHRRGQLLRVYHRRRIPVRAECIYDEFRLGKGHKHQRVYTHRHSSGRHPFHRRLHHGYRDIRPRGGFHHIRKPGGALSQRLLPH